MPMGTEERSIMKSGCHRDDLITAQGEGEVEVRGGMKTGYAIHTAGAGAVSCGGNS